MYGAAMRSSILIQKRAKVLRRNLTQPEQALWALLRRNQLDYGITVTVH